MTDKLHPISELVAEGWEIISSSSPLDTLGTPTHSVLLRRNGEHKFVTVNRKLIGKAPSVSVLDV
ncbi:MAG: hypothetical protein GX970_05640 [Phyllobacteriaceae bacterium]|nr:hypothetical protein [Phyllobacteriaceae bacterium]